MPFFIPSRLIEFEYLGGNDSEIDHEYEELAKDYQKEIDFAFFVTNFQYTKADYEQLTPKEIAFIMKAWETKVVNDTTLMRNSVLNAVSNAMRGKGKKFTELWNKKRAVLNEEVAHKNLEIVESLEKDDDKTWVDLVYAANGMRVPSRKGVNE